MTATTSTALDAQYVYGIAPAPVRAPRALGVGGAPVRLLTESGLCAAVSAAPGQLRARRRDLMAHQAVLDELSAQGPVIPMQFAVLTRDADAVRARLRDGQAHLSAQLDAVRGRVEMNLKGATVPGYFARLVHQDEGLRNLARRTRRRPDYDANVRLGEAIARAVRQEAERAARETLARLAPFAERTVQGALDDTHVLSTSFLLRAADEKRFREAVAELAHRFGDRLALSVTGPLPCYSFVETAPAAAGA
ncbi:GvpL/GvpF family gas vesicle protein [Streptomyces sp. NPDC005551]|uniref:GvpL/GvpF family gas vesicle protein n=1 Tax=unclassified Streptomyces TaxID=2593676 RepID=UPI0033E2B201